jgi:hypothetical protein
MTLHDTDTGFVTTASPPPLRPPKAGGISMRPAMIVLALAVLILATFVTIGAVSSHSPAPERRSTSGAAAVPGTTLRAVPAAGLLSPIVSAGEPPANVLDAVSVPAGAVRTAHRDNSGGGQFDAQVTFRSADAQAALIAFFAADMKFAGWQVFGRGPASHDPGAYEVLGKLAGSDGNYWEMGAVVSPTTFSQGGPARGETRFTIRLFQVSDT